MVDGGHTHLPLVPVRPTTGQSSTTALQRPDPGRRIASPPEFDGCGLGSFVDLEGKSAADGGAASCLAEGEQPAIAVRAMRKTADSGGLILMASASDSISSPRPSRRLAKDSHHQRCAVLLDWRIVSAVRRWRKTLSNCVGSRGRSGRQGQSHRPAAKDLTEEVQG